MESYQSNEQSTNTLTMSDEIKDYLLTSAKWTKFLSILGFIGIGLLFLGSFAVLKSRYSTGFIDPIWFFLLYITMGVLYFFPVYYLFQFSNGIIQGVNSSNQEQLTAGFRYLKSHFKFIGILAIIIISIYVLLFVTSMFLILGR